jgi:hypothetical protein
VQSELKKIEKKTLISLVRKLGPLGLRGLWTLFTLFIWLLRHCYSVGGNRLYNVQSYTYLVVFHLWCVVQCMRHLSLRISMPHNGLQHLYFSKTLSLGMITMITCLVKSNCKFIAPHYNSSLIHSVTSSYYQRLYNDRPK